MAGNPISPLFLTQPILHITGITQAVPDQDIISALHECLRARLRIDRQGDLSDRASGIVEFEKLENAEKAYATLHNFRFPQYNNCILKLSHSSNPSQDPLPSARVRLIKFLPSDISPGRLFSMFRPFGPIYRIALNYVSTPDGLPFFSGTALIEFYDESQASLAQVEMHCTELDGQTIAIEEYVDKRDKHGRAIALVTAPASQSRWAQATPFVPMSTNSADLDQRRASQQSRSSDPNVNVSKWASAQTHQQPYSHNPNTFPSSPAQDPSPLVRSSWAMSPHSSQVGSNLSPESVVQLGQKAVDPCNLFINGLGPDVDSNDLFNAFKQFGHIVSARVMKNETTGISRQFGFVSYTTEEATANALRDMDGTTLGRTSNRLVIRFHERKKHKEGRTKIVNLSSPLSSHLDHSGFENSLTAKLAAAESPGMSRSGSIDVRTDVQLSDAAGATQPSSQLAPALAMHSTSTDAAACCQPASLRLQTSLVSGRPDTPSCASPTPSSLSLTPLSEREKMLTAVLKLNDHSIGERLDELMELLMGLPAREKKLCLFNQQVLATKVAEAKEIIETPDEVVPISLGAGSATRPAAEAAEQLLPTPAATPVRPTSQMSRGLSSASVVSLAGSTLATSRVPSPPASTPALASTDDTVRYTSLTELAQLASQEIVRLAFSKPQVIKKGLLPETDQKVRKETDAWIDSLEKLSVLQQKQKVGEKVFKTLKGFKISGCANITVNLLDSEDLRSLAHLMNLYPEVLKARVLNRVGSS